MTKIVTKNSSTASAVPSASVLVQGELAVNVVDKRLFTENNSGVVVELGTNPTSLTTGSITVTGTVDGRDVAADGTKLDGIEPGATADQTAAQLLTAIKTVDGTGSGLDADKVDGFNISTASTGTDANTIYFRTI